MDGSLPANVAAGSARKPGKGQHLAGLRSTLQPALIFAGVSLVGLGLSRLALLIAYRERLPGLDVVWSLLVMGLRFDILVVAAVCFLPHAVHLLAPGALIRSIAWQRACLAWFAAWILVLTFNEAATPAFMAEFGVRPNRQFVEYLGTPGLVIDTLWQSNRVSLLVGIVLAVVASFGFRAVLRRFPARRDSPAIWQRVLVMLPLLVVLAYAARGSVGHRPLIASNAALTADAAVNDLALNSTYSVAYAVGQMWLENQRLQGYGHLSETQALKRVRAGMQLPDSAFAASGGSTTHLLLPTSHLARKPNLVILLEESLGAQFFASLGGQPVAQELDRWRDHSFWFDQLYATGTRSARGIEAVVTGFLPTRTSSVIKLEGAQRNFFTLARALKDQGYRTEFIYGGDASFDNMRRFFLNNGFDRVIDEHDLAAKAAFSTTWGVSDEDLYARVHEEAGKHFRDGKPFFTLVFSTSNHSPFDFPGGRIHLFEQPSHTRRNAARYADHALGAYLEQAERSPYWGKTVFAVMADHESNTTGPQLVPIFRFHIPGFITGGPVKPRIVSRLASQIDLLPTMLSLMGLTVSLPATGIDQSRTDLAGPGQAIMQFNDISAYRVGNRLNVMIPHQPARQFRIAGTTLLPLPTDPEMALDALAQSEVPINLYREHRYH